MHIEPVYPFFALPLHILRAQPRGFPQAVTLHAPAQGTPLVIRDIGDVKNLLAELIAGNQHGHGLRKIRIIGAAEHPLLLHL